MKKTSLLPDMKYTAMLVLMALPLLVNLSCQRCDTSAHDDQSPAIIPVPLEMEAGSGLLTTGTSLGIVMSDPTLENEASLLADGLLDAGIYPFYGDTLDRATVRLQLEPSMSFTDPEGYSLQVHDCGAVIRSAYHAGIFYGIMTFLQLIPYDSDSLLQIPHILITDQPRFRWRGLHLDVCRHFFPVEFIMKYLDQMARYKLNTFHWHLTEDQGWRIEIKKYPLLTEIGSLRKETILEKNFDPYKGDGIPYRGYYTQDEIRQVVDYASRLHITVVPEIEMPGHSLAALAAYPQYSCTGGPFEVATSWGVFDDIFCPREETFMFLEGILEEVVALFPGEYIHIGGDEAPKTRWKDCEACQRRIREEGLKDEHELQSYFIQRMGSFLETKGKKIIGWDEILEGGLAPGAAVMSWRGEDGGIAAAKQGHHVVMTPGYVMYFDHYQGDTAIEPLAIGGHTTIEDVYAYDPVPASLTAGEASFILGVQANVWTEYMKTPSHVEYMVNPRLFALSEISWSMPERKDPNDFRLRMKKHLPRLDHHGIHYRPLMP